MTSAPAFDPQNLNAMLRVCSLLQSVRALYNARDSAAVRQIFDVHLVALITELIPVDRAVIVFNDHGVSRSPDSPAELQETPGSLSAPLMVRNEPAGVITLQRAASPGCPGFGEPESMLLSAIAELASLALENAFQLEWLQAEVRRLESGLELDQLVPGDSVPIRELRDKIARVGPSEATVLITGESGTGKELVARALHQKSSRASKPFAAINCGALTETLLESELFGYEKGAFTGAAAQKRGRLEVAEGGTLFLDEVGEMPLGLQVKLLRVLQQREFERVGGTRTMKLNVRFLAATNRDLSQEIRKGAFRQDLFYRLNVVSLRAPPLRERGGDILLLATRFAQQFGERCGRAIHGISPEARALLRAYPWPGNVRELENAIESAVVMGAGDFITAAELPDILRGETPDAADGGLLPEAILAAKRAVIQRAFEQANQDHNEAARLLGVHPNYLYRLLKRVAR